MSNNQEERLIRTQILEWLNFSPKHGLAWIHKSAASRSGGTFMRRSKWDPDYISDIEGIWMGRPLYVEVKKPGGTTNKVRLEGQIAFLRDVGKRGGIGIIAASSAFVETILGDYKEKSFICAIDPLAVPSQWRG